MAIRYSSMWYGHPQQGDKILSLRRKHSSGIAARFQTNTILYMYWYIEENQAWADLLFL